MKSDMTDAIEKDTVARVGDELWSQGFADVGQAADFLRLSRTSIYKLMDDGTLKYAKFGKARRLPWKALREYASAAMVGAEKGGQP